MAKSAKYVLVGSTEAYSGKSATILGITHQLKEKGILVGYNKPVGTCLSQESNDIVEDDGNLVAEISGGVDEQSNKPLLYLDRATIKKRLQGEDRTDYNQILKEYIHKQPGEVILLEGPGNLWEGSLFNLSVGQIADAIDAPILLVARYHPLLLIDSLLAAKRFLGKRLLGVVINDIPQPNFSEIQDSIVPFLEQQAIPVFGILPRNNLLRSVSVRELARRLDAKVLSRPDRLDLMVETLTIGAMNVNSALGYFRQGKNMAVITGGDRTDLQLAALETSTHCLILTGHLPPQSVIIGRAEDLEIPILSVNLDTLATVEIVDEAFGKVPIHEPIKIRCIQEMMKEHFDLDRFMNKIGVEPPVKA